MYIQLTRIKDLLKTDTFKQSLITFSGTIINGVLGIVFMILAARYLGPSKLGLFTISIAVLTLVADIADLGVDTGLVRFVGKYSTSKPKLALSYLKLGLQIKTLIGIIIVFIGFLISGYLSDVVFGKPELFIPLRLAFVGVLGALLYSFVTHTLQAYQRFISWSALMISTNGIRLGLLLLIAAFGVLQVDSILIIYILMPMLGFVAGLFIIPYFLAAKVSKASKKDFFHYNKWVAAMTAVAAASSRLDVFISARFLELDQVGIYSAANQLVQVVPQIVAAFGTVIAPKMASMDTVDKMISYLKKTQALVGGVSLLGFIGIPFAFFFFPAFYGASYVSSIPIFIVLLIAMLIFLFAVPIHNAIFYYFSYPKLFFYLAIGHFIIIATSGLFFISQFGAIGAAISVLIGSIFNFVVPTAWVIYKIKTK